MEHFLFSTTSTYRGWMFDLKGDFLWAPYGSAHARKYDFIRVMNFVSSKFDLKRFDFNYLSFLVSLNNWFGEGKKRPSL